MSYGYFAPYVSVAEKKKQAELKILKLKKKGHILNPVVIEGRTIAKTFWGKSWCKNLESYSDYDYRLPRGRSYVRSGAVIDLKISSGEIKALVNGSSLYETKIFFSAIETNKWNHIVKECSGKIDSLIELLQGKLSQGIMEIITHSTNGLFPNVDEIKFSCSCPDYAYMCKHVAAVLYGIGARLDDHPKELFLLRQADYSELIAQTKTKPLSKNPTDKSKNLSDNDLSALFGIDIKKPGSRGQAAG